MIGDLTGFTASIALRGVEFVQIPTTLLAQVDSSVGGKTAINSPHGKNLIGTFYQPRVVIADTNTLTTLPDRELGAGYAETVKYGLLGDAEFFDWLEKNGTRVIARDIVATQHAVSVSCRTKAAIVERDERETSGARALLNLGHTFAHAIEAEAGYDGRVLHGEAVSVGIMMALTLSQKQGFQDVPRVKAHLASVGLPVSIDDLKLELHATALYRHMAQDKKVAAGDITFVLSDSIGSTQAGHKASRDAILNALRACGAS